MRLRYKHPPDDLIRKRYSCRTYADQSLDETLARLLADAASHIGVGLLGEKAAFRLVSRPKAAGQRFAGYGLIKGARSFIVGRISRSERARDSYGYLLEHLVLKAVDLGLDTVWVGYFHRDYFPEIRLEENELFPAAVVVGKAATRKRLKDRVVRAYVRAGVRRPWTHLFFEGDFRKPLSRTSAGEYSGALESVRLAPSSGNTQPWRVVKERDKPVFHFFIKRVKRGYARKGLHQVDLGIALAHFELAAEQAGLEGEWKIFRPQATPLPPGVEYRWTWVGRAQKAQAQR